MTETLTETEKTDVLHEFRVWLETHGNGKFYCMLHAGDAGNAKAIVEAAIRQGRVKGNIARVEAL